MERNKLEKKIIRLLKPYLKQGLKQRIDTDTRILMDMGLDSMDFMLLTDSIEKDFGFRAPDSDWYKFWSDAEVTVTELCDFVETRTNINMKRHGKQILV